MTSGRPPVKAVDEVIGMTRVREGFAAVITGKAVYYRYGQGFSGKEEVQKDHLPAARTRIRRSRPEDQTSHPASFRIQDDRSRPEIPFAFQVWQEYTADWPFVPDH